MIPRPLRHAGVRELGPQLALSAAPGLEQVAGWLRGVRQPGRPPGVPRLCAFAEAVWSGGTSPAWGPTGSTFGVSGSGI
ncbi:hypothetical protein [Jidongwangia harbinensis]|uniref:hypothetical protein n=1 Tax=Jidongwangia harbinensis TaxID=2878561 RepID=UPI001CD9C1C3|nr:hypothetical protein [Jidongwangia harbinensis]MCA2214682.1 hypothetical protein [Jidongwangia harbinensis]